MKKLILASLLFFVIAIGAQAFSETTAFTSFAANFLFKNNLHEIVPNKFFRSAQMNAEDLSKTIKEKNIKTVFDLRLQDDKADPYNGLKEEDVVTNSGAKYVHIPFSSKRANQKDKLLNLINSFKSVETPILVHCSSGTHRSGVAAAIWLITEENVSNDKILEQLSYKYGFFKSERKLKEILQGKPTLDYVIFEFLKNDPNHHDLERWINENISNE